MITPSNYENKMQNGGVASVPQEMPQDLDAERSVLGCLFFDHQSLDEITTTLFPTDFIWTKHAEIFVAILELKSEGKPIDAISVGHALAAKGLLAEIGGPGYLAELLESVPNAAHVAYHATLILNASKRRQIINHCRDIAIAAYKGSSNLDELAANFSLAEMVETKPEERFPLLSAQEFASGEYSIDYYIDGIMAVGQPMLVGATQKSLKTLIAGIDLSLSLASGFPFLGKFKVNKPAKVCFLSGESGLPALQAAANSVCHSRGWTLQSIPNWFISTSLPTLKDKSDILALEKLVVEKGIEVLIIDPIYLAMGVNSSESANIFEMGSLLLPLAKLCTKTGCTPILIHHLRAGTAKLSEKPDLSDLSHAGFAAFARQWLLISRRSAYQDDGRHELWLRAGGSAGHSSIWAVNVEEGSYDDADGRRWDVEVLSASQATAQAIEGREAEKEQKADLKYERLQQKDRAKILESLEEIYPVRETKNWVRTETNLNNDKATLALESLVSDGLIDMEYITKNGHEYDGFRLIRNDPDRPGLGQVVPGDNRLGQDTSLFRESVRPVRVDSLNGSDGNDSNNPSDLNGCPRKDEIF